ncbi:MAG: CorA family divalent cation transporter [Dehalococcoidales bacterium]|nr:CorA family divalent cation transporter [Dehalococcoidales bacterium]
MTEAEIKGTITNAGKTNGEPEVPLKPWFYVALSPSATILKRDFETPQEILTSVSQASIAWIDYVAQDFEKEAPMVATQMGFSEQLYSPLIHEVHNDYEDFETEMGLKLPSIQVRQLDVEPYPILFLIRKNFIMTIHPRNVDRRFMKLRRYSETILKKIPIDISMEDRLTLLLTRIIHENNDRNAEHLRQIEGLGDELNESMVDPNTSREKIAPEIYRMKHALITYLNALWDGMHVLHTLRYGDAELITNDEKLLKNLDVLADDVNRQIELAEHLSEVLASGLEVLQGIYNNQLQSLNNRLALLMTYLTILGTAVLVPNTLATIMSNSAFAMGHEDVWWYWILIIGSTILATGLVYWWVKKKGWITKKMY